MGVYAFSSPTQRKPVSGDLSRPIYVCILKSVPYTTSSATRIFWDESGQGDPLLIMGLGYTHEMWHRTRPLLSQHYRTIAFDNRGVGQSDVPAGSYSIAQMAADAAAVLDAAQIQRAHVFGISMGGMIAQEFALAYPHRVRSLILGCTACGGRNAIRRRRTFCKLSWPAPP